MTSERVRFVRFTGDVTKSGYRMVEIKYTSGPRRGKKAVVSERIVIWPGDTPRASGLIGECGEICWL